MKLKHLEHQGNEEFSSFTDRKVVKKIEALQEKKEKVDAEKQKIEDQKAWLSTANPFLWEGDFDA
jgi:hypothetical protein